MIYRNFPQIYLNWVDRKKLSSDPPSLGVISESFRLIKLLGARLEVVQGSWKGLQNPCPASVQVDAHLRMFNSTEVLFYEVSQLVLAGSRST